MSAPSSVKILNMIKKGSLKDISDLITNKVTLNIERKSDSKPSVIITLENGHQDVAAMIIQQAYSDNDDSLISLLNRGISSDGDESVLSYIIRNGHNEAFAAALESMPSIANSTTLVRVETKTLPIVIAAESNNLEATEMLLQSGAELNIINPELGVPASWSAATPEMSDLLYNSGRDDSFYVGETSLVSAIYHRALYEETELVVEGGMDIVDGEHRNGFQALFAYYAEKDSEFIYGTRPNEDADKHNASFFEVGTNLSPFPIKKKETSEMDADLKFMSNSIDSFIKAGISSESFKSRNVRSPLSRIIRAFNEKDFGQHSDSTSRSEIVKILSESGFSLTNGLDEDSINRISIESYMAFTHLLRNKKLVLDDKTIMSFGAPFLDLFNADYKKNEQILKDTSMSYYNILSKTADSGSIALTQYVIDNICNGEIDTYITSGFIESLVSDKQAEMLSFILSKCSPEKANDVICDEDIRSKIVNGFQLDVETFKAGFAFVLDKEAFLSLKVKESRGKKDEHNNESSLIMNSLREGFYTDEQMDVFKILVSATNIFHSYDSVTCMGVAGTLKTLEPLQILIDKYGKDALFIQPTYSNDGGFIKPKNGGMLPVHRAIAYGNIEAVKYILDLEKDNPSSYADEKLFFSSILSNESEMIDLMINEYGSDYGIDPLEVSKSGNNAYHILSRKAQASGYEGFYNILEKFTKEYPDIDINLKNNKGLTPLHRIANDSRDARGSVDTLDTNIQCYKNMIELGADPNILDDNGHHFLKPVVDYMLEASKESFNEKRCADAVKGILSELVYNPEYGIDASLLNGGEDNNINIVDAAILLREPSVYKLTSGTHPTDIDSIITFCPNILNNISEKITTDGSDFSGNLTDSGTFSMKLLNELIDNKCELDKLSAFNLMTAMTKLNGIPSSDLNRVVGYVFDSFPEAHSFQSGSSESILVNAIRHGNVNMVNTLLQKGANPNAITALNDLNVSTPLTASLTEAFMYASEDDEGEVQEHIVPQVLIIEALFEYGASIEISDSIRDAASTDDIDNINTIVGNSHMIIKHAFLANKIKDTKPEDATPTTGKPKRF